jgi:hypothetical protein
MRASPTTPGSQSLAPKVPKVKPPSRRSFEARLKVLEAETELVRGELEKLDE